MTQDDARLDDPPVPGPTDDVSAITAAVRSLDVPSSRPTVIGVSGFGGSGKSTLAAALAQALPDTRVIAGDEFLLERPPSHRSDNWDVVDRGRLRAVVLETSDAGILVVEGLGLFGPDLVDLFDLMVWLDVDLETSTAQGMWRDEHVHGNPQTELWVEVWKPNDEDFFRIHRPDLVADLLYRPAAGDPSEDVAITATAGPRRTVEDPTAPHRLEDAP